MRGAKAGGSPPGRSPPGTSYISYRSKPRRNVECARQEERRPIAQNIFHHPDIPLPCSQTYHWKLL